MDITSIIAHMQAERQGLLDKAAKLETAITTLQQVYGPPGPVTAAPVAPQKKAGKRPVGKPARSPRTEKGVVPERLLAALKAGSMTVSEIKDAYGVSKYQLMKLVRSGALVGTGNTRTRRIALPSATTRAAAKEAP